MIDSSFSKRRSFIKTALLTAGAAPFLRADVRQLSAPKPLGVAILGLGGYAKNWIAPAIEQSKYCALKGIITGSPEKIPEWQEKYDIPDSSVYNYENFEKIADNKDIDIVYVITPTGTHADFTIRALNAGKHVICEKPMANTEAECDAMITAAKKNDRILQIGYRLYWDPFNMQVMAGMRDKQWGGDWTALETKIAYDIPDHRLSTEKNWRVQKKYSAGGALYEIGVYALQGAFYSSQELPLSVTAKSVTRRKEIFQEVAEEYSWELEWSGGRRSTHLASFGDTGVFLKMSLPEGELFLDRAFEYTPKSLTTPDGDRTFTNIFQQKRQIDGQALAILNRNPILTPGEMGRRDIYVLQRIMEAAESGDAVKLDGFKYY